MCKYAKNDGIVVKTAQQRQTIDRVILKSQNSKQVAPKSKSVGAFDPKLWEIKKPS